VVGGKAYTASQVRTTSRSWDKGVLTELCLTRLLTDLCLTLYITTVHLRNFHRTHIATYHMSVNGKFKFHNTDSVTQTHF